MANPYSYRRNPNLVEGQPVYRGDVLLKNAAQLDKLKTPGTLGVTSPDFINGSKKFALEVFPVGSTPGDIIQVQKPFDAGFPAEYRRKLTSGVWGDWSDNVATPLAALEAALEAGIKADVKAYTEEVFVARNIGRKTIDTTDATSILPATKLGAYSIPADTFVVPGSRLRVRFEGAITTPAGTPKGKLDLVVGTVTLAGDSLALPLSLTRAFVKCEITMTLVTETTLRITGSTSIRGNGASNAWYRGIAPVDDIAFDGTVDTALDAIYTFDTADSALEIRELEITKLTTFKEEVAE